MHDQYDLGIQSCLGKSGDFLVCAAIAESEKDGSVHETQFRQVEHIAGYGRVHWKPEKENRVKGI